MKDFNGGALAFTAVTADLGFNGATRLSNGSPPLLAFAAALASTVDLDLATSFLAVATGAITAGAVRTGGLGGGLLTWMS
jgi:hypothetical protein